MPSFGSFRAAVASAALLAITSTSALAQGKSSLPPGYEPYTEAKKSPLIGKTIEYKVPDDLATPDALRFDRPFQQGPRCGPNGLFVLLRLCGVDATYEEVLRSVPLTEKGSDIDSLRKAAAQFGLDTEVRKLTPEELQTAPKPMLVHLTTPASGTGHRHEPTGHFTVVTYIDPMGKIQGIDTSNALYTSWNVDHYARGASGYCLVPVATTRSWLFSAQGVFLVANFVLLVVANLVLMAQVQKKEAHAPA